MNLSFSTNRWTGYSFEDFLRIAKTYGFQGIELHDVATLGGDLAAARRALVAADLRISCIDMVADIASDTRSALAELRQCLDAAAALRCPYVRVRTHAEFSSGEQKSHAECAESAEASSLPPSERGVARSAGGSTPGSAAASVGNPCGHPCSPCETIAPDAGAAESAVRAFLAAAVPEAEASGATLLIETAGPYADTARLRDLLGDFISDSLAALWDLHHTYRDAGESPEATITNLGAYVRHVHMRDSESPDSPALVGEGSLPIPDIMNALRSVNFDGFVSVEWDPAWAADLADLDIVFPHFIAYMSRYEGLARARTTLFDNHDRTGKYVWKKEELIEKTFGQVLDTMAETFPDQYAVKYTTLDYTRTYAQFRDDVDTFARALISLGVKPGTHVAVWTTNVPQWYIAFWAVTKIGSVLVAMNTNYKIHEAEYLLKQSDTHTLILIESCRDSMYAEIINELCPELRATEPGKPLHAKRLPFLRNVITVGFRQPGSLTWEEAVAHAPMVPVEEVRRRAAATSVHDVCNMQYTSGTTGFPKGVMLTHYNVVNNGKCIGDRMGLSTADRMMIQVPMFHCFGMVLAMTASMTHGATILPMPYFSPKSSLACIDREKVTCFHGVPTMFIAMFTHPDFERTDFSHMRTGIMAGSNCPPELMRRAAKPHAEGGMDMRGIVSVYGQTESAPGDTQSDWQDPLDERCDTVGYAFAHVECRIIDPATGRDLPDGQVGEFVARGYNLMKGYYKMPKATAETIDADGWLHTGDLCCSELRPDTGHRVYRVTGRLKDMIIRGGENIYPREIEEFLYTHPKIQDVQVIGVPDKAMGEEVMACIILKEGETSTEDEIKAYVLAHMAKFKVPRYVEFMDAFPMNPAGKILKYKMRENAVKKLGLG